MARRQSKRQRVVTTETAEALKPATPAGVIADEVSRSQQEREEEQAKKRTSPSEVKRKARRMIVTFSDEAICDRVRALAERWGWKTKGGLPNTRKLIEYLLLPQLLAAEKGEIAPPEPEDE